ncbi:MAG: transglycosylase SLT domain-containing protein [Deltaproteobacteria bacterium]|nr:transglycosylase SLT domain-containing protein [Deltaproteobacteria bacterium]
MSWRLGILMAVLAWLFLAGPAVAGIQSHTDSRGVIHIGNVPPSQPNSPSAVPEAMSAPPEMTAPAAPQPSQLKLDATAAPEADLEAIQQACQGLARGEAPAHEFDGIIAAAELAAAEQEAAEVAEVAVDYNYLPVRKASHEQGGIPVMAPQPVAPKPAEVAAAGGIRRHRDAQGIWHISNGEPAPAMQMAHAPNSQGSASRQVGQPAAAPELPIRQAAWSPDERRQASLPTSPIPARQTASGPSPIFKYRDSKGVIHIANVEPEPSQTVPAHGLMARNRHQEESESQGLRPAPTLAASGWAIRPAAWNGEGGIKPLPRVKAAPSKTAELTTDGGIRRYRDKQGVVHIKTVEYPLPPGVVLPPRQASSSLMAPMAAAPSAPAVSNLPVTAASAPPAKPPAYGGAGARITAFKDAKGRLRITTELPQAVPGKMPSPLPVYAELEPLILEAAQIHRLPPTLIKAVIKVESDFCSWAVSPKGAMGLMQLMPGTANLLGVREPFNPRDNILGGTRYLRDLIDLFGGNLPLALASYNAGYQRVINCGYQIPAIKETQDFVTAVMGRYVAEEQRGRQPWT